MTSISVPLNNLVNRKVYETSKVMDIIEFSILSAVAVLIPLLLRHPQLLVGSAVNFVLIMAGINVKGWKKIIPLVVLPGVSALAGGYLFGPFTVFLMYLVPFIWIGNSILVLIFKWLYAVKRANYFVVLPIAAILKAGFLFGMAFLLVESSVVPSVFLKAMGMTQFLTALIGGLAVFPVNLLYRRYFPKKQHEE